MPEVLRAGPRGFAAVSIARPGTSSAQPGARAPRFCRANRGIGGFRPRGCWASEQRRTWRSPPARWGILGWDPVNGRVSGRTDIIGFSASIPPLFGSAVDTRPPRHPPRGLVYAFCKTPFSRTSPSISPSFQSEFRVCRPNASCAGAWNGGGNSMRPTRLLISVVPAIYRSQGTLSASGFVLARESTIRWARNALAAGAIHRCV